MFDSNAMQELAHLSRQRYERAGGGGTHKVYASSRTYDESHGYKEMSSWDQLVYRTNMLWRSESRSAMSGFRQDCHDWERDSVESRCSYVRARKHWGLADDIPF